MQIFEVSRGTFAACLAALACGALLSGCGGAATTQTSPTAVPTTPTPVIPTVPGANIAPVISGTPAVTVAAGATYSFQPTASDSNGDTLSFSIQNKPAWATFSTSTGRLTGTAPASGSFANVIISVSDGTLSTALAAFTITVGGGSGTSSATLRWTVPGTNTDGSTATDLAGFRLYYGSSAAGMTNSVEIASPSSTSYVLSTLTAGTYYFGLTAYSAAGIESAMTNVLTATVP